MYAWMSKSHQVNEANNIPNGMFGKAAGVFISPSVHEMESSKENKTHYGLWEGFLNCLTGNILPALYFIWLLLYYEYKNKHEMFSLQ